MAKRARRTFEDRVAEYVDSPLMTHRVKYGKQICARIAGNFGVYLTRVSHAKKADAECTCPSELQPCKHIAALRETWKVDPHSFYDLDQFLAELSEQPKAKLVEAIAEILVEAPEFLGVFGVEGFELEENGDWEDE